MTLYAMSGILANLQVAGPSDPSVVIGVVDGIPDLECADLCDAKITVESSMVPHQCFPADSHGTEVCSLIFGKNFGVASACSGIILPVFFQSLRGESVVASQMDIARALNVVVQRDVDIVNISAGQKTATAEAGRHLEDALAYCNHKRVLVIAAAGNDGCPCLHVPAAVATVLAVGAMDEDGHPTPESNWGPSYRSNGLLAPGAFVSVTTDGGTSSVKRGTSYAAAIVTGVAARLLSISRILNYSLDALDIRSVLLDSADMCDAETEHNCDRILGGRINVKAAIDLLHKRGRSMSFARQSEFDKPKMIGGLQMSSESNVPSNAADHPSDIHSSVAADMQQLACSCGGTGTCHCKHEDAEDAKASARLVSTESPVRQQECSCGKKQSPQLVYSIGALWFDFGSEARYDAIVQQMNDPVAANNPSELIDFLSNNLAFASGVTFILMQDQIPVYAIKPAGPFAIDIYKAMLDALKSSLDPNGDMQRVAIPGQLSGTTRLMNGMQLPVVYPDLRGMVKWEAQALALSAKAAVADEAIDEGSLFNFLVRVYDELRNFGISAEERAMNFAATNAYQAAMVFGHGARERLELYKISVGRSPICRPDSDCWDVRLIMFDPENDRRAGRFYRFTVDVSEIIPVTVGRMRSWSAPLLGA
ncbi:PatA/PatG family cyanobactin maturation protease [Rhizobium ruizarguesonis]|uniref:PatA/PatG family cyanobactin maturation protease n=1 Tax=Rhizobium ruizarguesonis TaxID=2081791 RepID=UPI0013F1602D|nr:PatA/PatG family cyanobactin maturation protease [Rhizobium ruizarguesonis]WSH21222.1 PatA/PatG family cyanobactin maturation protease [Rhizobium ruizarguesonis]WSH34113.1 PatA/PatG family cyanobactin maturation protease [Rhizobium ruizarguesonis]